MGNYVLAVILVILSFVVVGICAGCGWLIYQYMDKQKREKNERKRLQLQAAGAPDMMARQAEMVRLYANSPIYTPQYQQQPPAYAPPYPQQPPPYSAVAPAQGAK